MLIVIGKGVSQMIALKLKLFVLLFFIDDKTIYTVIFGVTEIDIFVNYLTVWIELIAHLTKGYTYTNDYVNIHLRHPNL